MGGLALKHLGVKRIDAEPYRVLTREVTAAFWMLFKQELHIIQAYFAKPDYGDCDAVVVSSKLPPRLARTIDPALRQSGHGQER